MRLTRAFVEIDLTPNGSIELPKDTASHIVKVLRARPGDGLVLFNGNGCEHVGAIESIRGPRVTVSVGEARAIDRESPLHIILVQSIPRGDRMDFVIQKATELGVSRIVPVLSARSVVRLDERQSESKVQHWRGVAISACEQCGRNRVPKIDAPLDLIDYLGSEPGAPVRLLLDPESASGEPVKSAQQSIEVTVGPEGGFSPQELDAMRVAGLKGIRLGPRILRTETAALVALTWLQTRYGDMNPIAT
jgi:16S rRNA (uracil1498-N3)-methyltransferase